MSDELPTVLINKDELVCPHCHVAGRIQEVGSILKSNDVTYEPEDPDGPARIRVFDGGMNWDSWEFSHYECRGCGEMVALPDGLEIEDLT